MSKLQSQLSDTDAQEIREGVATIVLGTPPEMRESLETDPAAHLTLVSSARVAAEEASRLLREAVDGARKAGHSWDTLGQLLGVSRQAAQQRFGSSPAADNPDDHAGDRKVLSPLTAFDEMPILEEEGRHGWHSVDYGNFYHVVEKSPWQWEHRRVSWSPLNKTGRLESEGWELIKSMKFPWAYYKRCTDRPAE